MGPVGRPGFYPLPLPAVVVAHRCCGTSRRFLLAVDDARLVGGLALEQKGWPGLEALRMMSGGYLCPDHMDLLAAPGETGVAVGLLRGWLQRPGARLWT